MLRLCSLSLHRRAGLSAVLPMALAVHCCDASPTGSTTETPVEASKWSRSCMSVAAPMRGAVVSLWQTMPGQRTA